MYHSVTFGNKNTWDDWHIVPSSRPMFAVPKLKEKSVDIPGMNGRLDFSSAIRGYPVFESCEGTFEFIVLNEYFGDDYNYKEPIELLNEISAYLDGSIKKCVLEDDPDYYRMGRFYVSQWTQGGDYSRISIGYTAFPYKKLGVTKPTTDWTWDDFNFETDATTDAKIKNIQLNDWEWDTFGLEDGDTNNHTLNLVYTRKDFGSEPICPDIRVTCGSGGVDISYQNNQMKNPKNFHVTNGSNVIPDLILCGPALKMSFKSYGNATLSLNFTKGEM